MKNRSLISYQGLSIPLKSLIFSQLLLCGVLVHVATWEIFYVQVVLKARSELTPTVNPGRAPRNALLLWYISCRC